MIRDLLRKVWRRRISDSFCATLRFRVFFFVEDCHISIGGFAEKFRAVSQLAVVEEHLLDYFSRSKKPSAHRQFLAGSLMLRVVSIVTSLVAIIHSANLFSRQAWCVSALSAKPSRYLAALSAKVLSRRSLIHGHLDRGKQNEVV